MTELNYTQTIEAVKSDTLYTLTGWVASNLGKITEFWTANENGYKHIKLGAKFYSRPDVLDFYPQFANNVDSLGFEFGLSRSAISECLYPSITYKLNTNLYLSGNSCVIFNKKSREIFSSGQLFASPYF